MRWRGPGASRRGRRRGRPRRSAGWSLLIRSMTLVSSASGSISRAAAARAACSSRSRSQPSVEDRVGVEPVERAQADQRVVALAPDRPVVGPARAACPRASAGTARPRSWPIRWPARGDAARPRGRCVRRRRRRARRRRSAARRRSRSRSAASAGPAGPSPGSWLPRGRWRSPRAGRRSRRAARASGAWSRANSRNRPSPTCRGRTTGAPRCAARRCRRWRGGRCGSRGRARSAACRRQAGRVERLDAAEVRAFGGELAPGPPRDCRRRAGRRPGAGRRRCRGPGCRGPAAGSASRRGRRAGRRAGPGSPRARARQRRSGAVVGHVWAPPARRAWAALDGSMIVAAVRSGGPVRRRSAGDRRIRRWRARRRSRLGERRAGGVDHGLDVGSRSPRSGSRRGPVRADIPPSSTSRARRAARKAARSRSTLNSTKFVRTRAGSSGPGAGWAVPPAATMPSISASASARRRALAWSSARRSIIPSGPSRQGDQAGRREDARLAHPATDHLARAAGAPDEVARTDDHRADRAGERLGQAERDGVGRAGEVGRADALGDDRVPEPGAVDVERDAVRVGDVRDLRGCTRASAAGPSSGRGCSRW